MSDINDIVNILSKFDPVNLLAMAAMFWMFKKHLDGKFDKIDKRFEKIDEQFEKINEKFEKVDIQIKELRTSLNRMEGAFYSKECCMLKEDKHQKRDVN